MKVKQEIFRLVGISFFIKAMTHIAGGLIGICGMAKVPIDIFMRNMASNMTGIYTGMLLQLISCIAIIALGASLYRITASTNKIVSIFALCCFLFEAVLLAVGQVFVFALAQAGQYYASSGDPALLSIGEALMTCWDFSIKISFLPFGLGAIVFYALLLSDKSFPAWLALWGILTVVPVLVGTVFEASGFAVPMMIMLLYAPYEFIAGPYIAMKCFRPHLFHNQ